MYILEGNIGAGKSTFLTLVEKQLPHVSVSLEPVYEWQNKIYGQSLLANFYQDPQRWAYTFENLTLISRVQNHLNEQQHVNPYRITERSIYSGNYVFARNSYESGFLTALEWHMYQEWFNVLTQNICKPPQGFIYLRVNPEVAYHRIKKRNRHAEKGITLSYLRQVHEKHEAFLVQKHAVQKTIIPTPVLTLDVDQEFETDSSALSVHIKKVMSFLEDTQRSKYSPHSYAYSKECTHAMQ